MKFNHLKCDWVVQETDFLGFWMTPNSVKLMKKKIDAVLKMSQPQNNTQAQSFIGAVNFYRSLWPCRAHVLALLTELTGNKPFIWTESHQHALMK